MRNESTDFYPLRSLHLLEIDSLNQNRHGHKYPPTVSAREIILIFVSLLPTMIILAKTGRLQDCFWYRKNHLQFILHSVLLLEKKAEFESNSS